MQCKDIPTIPILKFLAKNPKEWHNWFFGNDFDVRHAMPNGFKLPDNLVLSKMKKLIKKELIDGCDCGCRGDFVINQKGLDEINKNDSRNP